MDKATFNAAIEQLMAGKKYRGLDIPRDTYIDLLEKELAHTTKKSDAIKAVKAKLHNIIAPYLETLDYLNAHNELEEIRSQGKPEAIKEFCVELLSAHDSTRERIPYLSAFYEYIFKITGDKCTIFDLACAMNPFCLPLVDSPAGMAYRAYDIHQPRVDLINDLFTTTQMDVRAVHQDILVHPPTEKADAAFLFKEAHRIEKRESGATRTLMAALQAAHIFISLPTHSLNGKYDLRPRMEKLVDEILPDTAKLADMREFPAEMIFHIRKSDG